MKSDPAAFFRKTILVHESERHSVDPKDRGNWHGGKLVGSKYGVTGDALAAYRKVDLVTHDEMAKLTADEAVALGLAGYYHVRGLDTLPWDAVVAGVVDLGFNAGPSAAIKVLQRLIGAGDDGRVGPGTRKAYETWRSARSEAQAMSDWTKARIVFYRGLGNPRYENGWVNRANSFLSGTPWWKANVA